MFRKLKTFHYYLLVTSVLISLTLYVFVNYDFFDKPISSVELVFSEEVSKKDIPIIYISSDKESKINFKTVYKFQDAGNFVYKCELDDSKKLRTLRLYFPYPNRDILIKSISVKSSDKVVSIPLQKFEKCQGVKCIEQPNDLKLEILTKNGYIELPSNYIYRSDFKNIYQLILPILVLLILIVIVLKCLSPISIKPFSIQNITLIILVLSIFLPNPIYNIALILMAVLNVKKISWAVIKTQKINLIIIGFFMIYLINNLIISEESFLEMRTIERFLPFIILAIVLPSIAYRKYLYFFLISAFTIGFVFFITSIFDVYIHQNFVFISFDFFTKYLHPIYFSYLLFFSICYVDINFKGYSKYILQFVLFIFLIFSGSKMVLVFSLLLVFFNLIKNKKTAIVIIPIVMLFILFSPLKTRFAEIKNEEDLSVLKENKIQNPFDARINGLTMRLILWRETLATMNGFDYLLGKGVTRATNKTLENRLDNLGMRRHLTFNPHNQYIDTFWRTGIIGLVLLISIPIYSLLIGIKRKDKLIILFSFFMIAVMFSESIFGRVRGIYFFTTILLVLINTKKLTVKDN